MNIETKITGTVSLDADKKGINMSRIIRIFYEYKKELFSPEILGKILRHYKDRLDSQEARLKADFSYPMVQQSLRSGLEGISTMVVVLRGSLIGQTAYVRSSILILFIHRLVHVHRNYPSMPARKGIYWLYRIRREVRLV